MAASAASKPTPKRAPAAASAPAPAPASAAPAPVLPAPIPVPVSVAAPEPVPEPAYNVTLRLAGAAITGDSEYHLTWPASLVRRYLADDLVKVAVPLRGHLGQQPPDALRFVHLGAVAEVLIFNWPDRPAPLA